MADIAFDRNRHGSLYDRGNADAYYGRDFRPHYWPDGDYTQEVATDLTPAMVEEYRAGYRENPDGKKEW